MSQDDQQPLYSTATGSHKKSKSKNKPTGANASAGTGPLKIRREKKGRAGKTATVLFDIPFDKKTAKDHLRTLKNELACGASYKDGMIILQGDVLEKTISYFKDLGIHIVHSGG